jgi:hypothetical protein
MAGSIKWFEYTTDNSTVFAIQLDESNVEALVAAAGEAAGEADYTSSSTVIFGLPRNVKPRTVSFANSANTVRREIVAPTLAIYNGVAGGATITDAVSGLTLTFVSKKGERISVPRADDTGLNDTDAT